MINYGLKDRVAIITGANNPQGIGATTAYAFAREGAKVVLVYKKIERQFDDNKTDKNGADRYFKANAGNANVVENRLKGMNSDYLILESDITDENAVKEIYSKVLEKYGRVDVLVNNAADGDMDGLDTIEKITQKVIDDTFAVNVRGSLLMTREFVNHRGNYGRIINISTDSSQIFAGQITYGASKATIEALTRSIALEVSKYGITVNCIAPGPTQTGWIDEELEKAVIPLIPMSKLIQPEDIAETILFLASEQAKMLTGQVIKVSGGHALQNNHEKTITNRLGSLWSVTTTLRKTGMLILMQVFTLYILVKSQDRGGDKSCLNIGKYTLTGIRGTAAQK